MRAPHRAFHLPDHLKNINFVTTPALAGRCMIVGKPFYKYPIAVVPPPSQARPLFEAIRSCEFRPFRIVSYEDDAQRVFNCSFFDDEEKMRGWVKWLAENALEPGSQFHECIVDATEGEAMPSADTLLFGRGTTVLADTRFGEYQLGMTTCFTRQVPCDAERYEELQEGAAAAEFEERIARCMTENGVSYFGRLAMVEDPEVADEGKPPALITALRYGSLDDAKRGTAAVRALMAPELTRWFGEEHESSKRLLIGTTTQTLEL